MDRDWLATLIALGEIIALQHARDRVLRREPNQPDRAHLVHPVRVEDDARFVGIENLENLLLISSGVGLDFLDRERRSRGIAPRWVADQTREIADQKQHLVAEILES